MYDETWKEVAKHHTDGTEFDTTSTVLEHHPIEHDVAQIKTEEKSEAQMIYQSIEQLIDKDDDLKGLFHDVKRSIVKYIIAIDRLSEERLSDRANDSTGEIDRARTVAHEALITNLNILSRECQKKRVDNKWRSVIGLDRKQITNWALSVYPMIADSVRE